MRQLSKKQINNLPMDAALRIAKAKGFNISFKTRDSDIKTFARSILRNAKKLLVIIPLFISISAMSQTIKGRITEVKGDTVTVSGERFIIMQELCVGDSITLTATNISNRFTRRKRNAKKAETFIPSAAEFAKTN